MKHIIKFGMLVLIFLFSSNSYAIDCSSECQMEQIKSYFNALDKISRSGSKVTDVDELLWLTHDNVKYIHVEYEANFDKTSWRKAFIRNLERGAYKNGPKNEIRILNTIFGKITLLLSIRTASLSKTGLGKREALILHCLVLLTVKSL